MEREADAFAAELLMPEDQVRAAIRNGNRSLNDLASEFGVSSLAMKYRLQGLRYTFA
jgi:Zn-dependent peptidase ImmA (M78 family)